MSLAIAGRIVSEGMQGNSRQGWVMAGGVARKASLDLVPEARVGEYVLLRMDVAIQRIDNKQAARMEEALGRIGRLG